MGAHVATLTAALSSSQFKGVVDGIDFMLLNYM